jgi:hypothetical protein
MKGAFKSKTIWFSLLLGVFGAVQASWGLIDDFLSPRAAGFGAMAIAVLVAALRVVTTSSLEDK